MKRMLIFISLLVIMFSCNIMPKECEQVEDIIGNVPEMIANDYNDCEIVNQNYMYFAKWLDDSYMEHYPEANDFLSQEGDTVMIKGFVSHGYGITTDYYKNYWICYLISDSLDAMDTEYTPNDVTIFGDNPDMLSNIDFSRKCYVKSTVKFEDLGYAIGPSDPKSCYSMMPSFKVIEIKN